MSLDAPVPGLVHSRAMSSAYERGWAEGWNAALAAVQEAGVDSVLEREENLQAGGQLRLEKQSA